eukprot:4657607-Pyramimonas_sp.AAC.1
MLSFRGAGARTQARQYYTKEQNYLVSDLHDFKVPIVRVHKVLGARFNDRGTMSDEITGRIRSSRSALRPMKKVVASCAQLDLTHKVSYSEAYAGSKFLFAAGTWDPLPRYLQKRALTGYMSLYRTPLNLGATNCSEAHASAADILVKVQRLPLHVVMTVARLRLLPRIFCGAPPL